MVAAWRAIRVHHPDHTGVDQRIGGHPVEVQNVEHSNVTGADPPQQSVDVPVDPGGPDDARTCRGSRKKG
jgi:hypothetical protein